MRIGPTLDYPSSLAHNINSSMIVIRGMRDLDEGKRCCVNEN